MADQYRRSYEDDYRPQDDRDRGWTERAGDEVRTWFGDDDARARRQQDERQQYGNERERSWRDPYEGSDERSRGGPERSPYSQGGHYPQGGSYAQGGQYRQYGGAPSYGRGYPESDFMPHRVGSSSREAEHRYGPSNDWRTSGSSGQDQSRWGGESSWGSAGSYGRSQGAGSFGGSSSPNSRGESGRGSDSRGDFSGGYGGDARVEPHSGGWSGTQGLRETYSGRGPKGYQRSDDRIREDASDRLEQDHGVDASDISVQVQNGEITLTGTVTSRDQKRRAEDCVETVSGVREVTNYLRVNRGDARGQQAPASETSSSILGLGGQKSRESEGSSATQSSGGGSSRGTQGDTKSGRSNSGTSGNSGLSA